MPTKTVAEVLGDLATKNAQLQARLSVATDLLRKVMPLLENGVEPENAKFLGNIWRDAAVVRLNEARAFLGGKQ